MAGTIEVPDTILDPLTGGSPQPIAAQGIAAKRYQTGLPVRGDMAPVCEVVSGYAEKVLPDGRTFIAAAFQWRSPR